MKKVFEQEFVEKECVTCGCFYWVPAEKLRVCRENKDYFYCYNGHAQCFTKTASQLKQEEIERKNFEISRQATIIADLKRQLTPSIPVKRKAKRICAN